MAKVPGLGKLTANIKRRIAKAKKDNPTGQVSGTVGYTEHYAIYQHENLEYHHTVGKAKYLTDPLNKIKPNIARTVTRLMKRGKTLPEAILIVCERLLAKSQAEVPVDTGALKNSGYARLEQPGTH